jgi:hypothetical protein
LSGERFTTQADLKRALAGIDKELSPYLEKGYTIVVE